VDWLSDMAVVCSSKGSLYLIELSTGKAKLLVKLNGEIFSSPVVCDDHIVVGCRDNYVYCFDIVDELTDS